MGHGGNVFDGGNYEILTKYVWNSLKIHQTNLRFSCRRDSRQLIAMGSSIKYVRKIFRKTNISNSLIRTHTYAHHGVRNVSFSENFPYVLNRWTLQIRTFRLVNAQSDWNPEVKLALPWMLYWIQIKLSIHCSGVFIVDLEHILCNDLVFLFITLGRYYSGGKCLSVGIYLFKVSHGNTRAMCNICSKLTIKTPERRHLRRPDAFIVNFEHISHKMFSCFLVDFEQVNVDWVSKIKRRYSGLFLRTLNIVLLNVSSQDENHSGICAMFSGLEIKDGCLLILKYNPVPGVH